MSRHLAVGVIGHVDHGKTSLVKALTGMDTDRLPEEKARGMSIALGFAWREFDNGTIDLIDVPGHENFVHTMIGGAGGMEASLLVVDAKEGVKPQTVEHLAITQLLGLRKGIVVITKSDQIPDHVRPEIVASVADLLRATYLAHAPVIFTSTVSGEGVGDLHHALRGLLDEHVAIMPSSHCYLPIDRVFSVPGCGTVVTGTLRLGCLTVGDKVEIMPAGITSEVRQVESHGKKVERLLPGQRAGVNLRQVKADALCRGMAIASVGLLRPGSFLNARVSVARHSGCSLRHGQSVRLLLGTAEVPAQVRLLKDAALDPGQSGYVQLRTRQPVAAIADEPFILRSDSPPLTIGGGRIIDPWAARGRQGDMALLDKLQSLENGCQDQVIRERLKEAGYAGLSISELMAVVHCGEDAVRTSLARCGATMLDTKQVVHTPFLDTLADMYVAALRKFHLKYPARIGAPLAYCRDALPKSVSDREFRWVAQRLCEAKRVEVDEGLARLYGYDPLAALGAAERKRAMDMEEAIRRGGMVPPDVEEVAPDERAHELMHLLSARGNVVVMPGEHPGRKVVFHREAIQSAQDRMVEAYPPPACFTVSEFRILVGSTRKFIVPLLTYFDSLGVTRRQGDKRVIQAIRHGGERSLVTSLVFKTSGPSHHG
jgi:selenocysteine-specific elongation factor